MGPRAGRWRRHDFRIEAQKTSRRGFNKMMIEPRGLECGWPPADGVPLKSQFRGWRKRGRGDGRLSVRQ